MISDDERYLQSSLKIDNSQGEDLVDIEHMIDMVNSID